MTGAEIAEIIVAVSGLVSVLSNIAQWVVGKKWKTKAVSGEEVLKETQTALAVVVAAAESLDKSESGKVKQTVTAIRDGVELAGRAGFAKSFDAAVQAVCSAMRVFGLGKDEDETGYTDRAVDAVRLVSMKKNLMEPPQ